MREWLKRLPWKGSEVARLPRVRIPLLLPMTNEVKTILSQSIINDEQIINEMFKTTLNNIFDAKLDIQDEQTLIMICSHFADKIEEYKK